MERDEQYMLTIWLCSSQHAASFHGSRHPRGAVRRAGVLVVLPDAGVHDLQCEVQLSLCCDSRLSRTTQAYLILAVVVGAAIGHFIFNPSLDVEGVLSGTTQGKGMACH